MDYLKIDRKYDKLLPPERDIKIIQMDICGFITYLRDTAYLKLSEEELLEGDSKHVGYIGIIDQLTINEEHRLKREVQTLRVEKQLGSNA